MGHVYDGTCRLCEETYTGTGISSHVKGCLTTHADVAAVHHGLLVGLRAGGPAGRFWMYVLVRPEAPLADLDAFLRRRWFDDDSTASAFEVEQTQYLDRLSEGGQPDDGDSPPLESMEVDVGAVLRPRMEGTYRFDPEQPTSVELTVFDPYPCPASLVEGDDHPAVAVVARNDLGDLPCSTCERPATRLCLRCVRLEEAPPSGEETDPDDEQDPAEGTPEAEPQPLGRFVCDECTRRHEGPLVEVENSPRTGVRELAALEAAEQ